MILRTEFGIINATRRGYEMLTPRRNDRALKRWLVMLTAIFGGTVTYFGEPCAQCSEKGGA